MGSLSNESFDQFLDSLKNAGITISNEAELRERLAEAQRWRFAFQTLAATKPKSIALSTISSFLKTARQFSLPA